jgi:ATP-dependent DNA helicase RecQ
MRRVSQQFPSLDYVRDVYELLCCFLGIAVGDGMLVTRELNLDNFCRTYGYFPTSVVGALDLLDKAGYIEYRDEDDASSRLRINVSRDELFRALFPSEERLVLSVLRHYGGIFVDYVYIDEDLLSRETGLSADDIYQIFLRLSMQKFISFIPRKHLPCVTFRCRRVDKEQISLPHSVYEERRSHYEKRIEAMLQYIEEDSRECRSRMLLRYFGEEAEQDCGICDVCCRQNERPMPTDEKEALRQHILAQLQSGPRNAYELDLSGFNPNLFEEVIDRMRIDGEISFDGPLLFTSRR